MTISIVALVVVGTLLVGFSGDIAEYICNHQAGAKRLLLYVLTVAAALAAFAFLPPAKAEVDFYPHSAVVVSFDISEGTILLEDGEEHLWTIYWEFTDDDPVEQGDVFSLLMWEAGTPTYKFDDEILDAVNSRIKAQ